MVCSMNVIIKPLSNDSEQIKIVREFLFKMIKKEFGYDYVPEWHEDIIKIEDYYINPKRNNFFVAYLETGEILRQMPDESNIKQKISNKSGKGIIYS